MRVHSIEKNKKAYVELNFLLSGKHINIYKLKNAQKTSTHHPLWNNDVHFIHRKVNFLYSALDQRDGVFEFIWSRESKNKLLI